MTARVVPARVRATQGVPPLAATVAPARGANGSARSHNTTDPPCMAARSPCSVENANPAFGIRCGVRRGSAWSVTSRTTTSPVSGPAATSAPSDWRRVPASSARPLRSNAIAVTVAPSASGGPTRRLAPGSATSISAATPAGMTVPATASVRPSAENVSNAVAPPGHQVPGAGCARPASASDTVGPAGRGVAGSRTSQRATAASGVPPPGFAR